MFSWWTSFFSESFPIQATPGQLGPGPMPMRRMADTGQQLHRATFGGLMWSSTELQRAHFQGITSISLFSFQLPQAAQSNPAVRQLV